MYVAPIEFHLIRHWFLNVNTKYDYLCLFLNGNGEYNDIINTEILDNAFLIDRATGDRICFFFCSTFGIKGSIESFNSWNIRERNVSASISETLSRKVNKHTPESLQSEQLREDVCDYYRILRSKLPALVFINKQDEHLLHPIKSFRDIRSLLTPLGILDDYQRDCITLDNELYFIQKNIKEYESKLNKINELKAVTKNAEERSKLANELVCKIISRCREYGFDKETLEKMNKYPAKIRQILSVHRIDDSDLRSWLTDLKNTVSQLIIVKENRLDKILNEILNLSAATKNDLYRECQEIKDQKEDCRLACLNNLNELNLALNVDSFMQAFHEHKTEIWLNMLLKLLQSNPEQSTLKIDTRSENKKRLKCFIAGALALNNERNAIISGINDLNLANNYSGYQIECYSFGNFNKYMSPNGQQYDYDSFIREEADICIFILDNAVGGITMNEYMLAIGCWKASGYKKPIVFVFSNKANDGISPSEDILFMRSHMKEHNQYWIDYSSIEVLQLKSQLNLQRFYKNGVNSI